MFTFHRTTAGLVLTVGVGTVSISIVMTEDMMVSLKSLLAKY